MTTLTETFGFRQGLDEKLLRTRAFYGIMAFSILLGIGLTFTPIQPMNALFWTAVINGVVGATTAGMFLAAAGLFLL